MKGLHVDEQFARRFGGPPDLVVYSPGRVNLIGEHTDYNDGFVFPAALGMGTVVAARRRAGGRLHTVAARLGGEDATALDDPRPTEGAAWARFVRGVAALLIADGYALSGADLYIDGDLPLSSGLSSSASLEVGVAAALLSLAGYPLDRRKLARLGQRVENEIIGVQSGIMDPLAVACGVTGHALLIDCRSLDVRPVPLPAEAAIVVLDSAIPRALAGSAYNQRRAECESAVRKLQAADPAIRALRDVTPELLAAEARRLDAVELRRARHVVSENRRVLDSLAALQANDLARFGALMVASHDSLRDDYEVSSPDLDRLVRIANGTAGVLGARQTGGGFGGCAVALVAAGQAEGIGMEIMERYRAITGREGRAYVSAASEGVRVNVI